MRQGTRLSPLAQFMRVYKYYICTERGKQKLANSSKRFKPVTSGWVSCRVTGPVRLCIYAHVLLEFPCGRVTCFAATLVQSEKRVKATSRGRRRQNKPKQFAGGKMMEQNLSKFQVGNIPTVIYVPDFITESEETHLLDKVYGAPISKWKSLKNRRLQNWGGIVHEKGLLPQDLPPWLMTVTQRISEESELFPSAINHVLVNEYLPDQGIMPHQDGPAYFPVVAIISLGSPVVMDFTPHSRLIRCKDVQKNDVDGKDSDKETLESGMHKWMDNHHTFSVILMPRSLLIFKDSAYSDYLHGIKDGEVHQYDEAINEGALMDYKVDQTVLAPGVAKNNDLKVMYRTTNRISLTCRSVLKVRGSMFKF